MCSYCSAQDCGRGASVVVSIDVDGMDWSRLTNAQQVNLSMMYATVLVDACGAQIVDADKVSSRTGVSAHDSTTQFRSVLTVSPSSSASEVAAALRAAHFRERVLNSTRELLGLSVTVAELISIGPVSVEPVAFVTTTVTTTSSTLTTTTVLATQASVTTKLEAIIVTSTEDASVLSRAGTNFKAHTMCFSAVFLPTLHLSTF